MRMECALPGRSRAPGRDGGIVPHVDVTADEGPPVHDDVPPDLGVRADHDAGTDNAPLGQACGGRDLRRGVDRRREFQPVGTSLLNECFALG